MGWVTLRFADGTELHLGDNPNKVFNPGPLAKVKFEGKWFEPWNDPEREPGDFSYERDQ